MKKTRKLLSMVLALGMTMTSLFCLTSCGSGSSDSADESPSAGNYKSEISVALAVEPPSMDPHTTGTTACRDVTRYIYECLFELDSSYSPQPQLAESYTADDDYTHYEITLRQGVLFHNGDEMKAEDVVSSLNRWLLVQKVNYAVRAIKSDDGFYKVDDYTVAIDLNQSCVTLPDLLACPANSPVIMPAETADAAGLDQVSEYIGTGSLKYEEYVQTQYYSMVKFDDYAPPADADGNVYELNGQWGDRRISFDKVTFYFVNDSQVRLAGVQNGDYDILTNLDYEDIEAAKTSGLQMITDMGCNSGISFNLVNGLFIDDNLRAAAYYAMDPEEIALGSILDEDYYYTDSCYLAPDSEWHTSAADDNFGQDIELAKQYLEAANYDGTPIVLIATTAYPELYRSALIMQQELEAVGFTVDFKSYDWTNFITKALAHDASDRYDLFALSYPVQYCPSACNYLYNALTGLSYCDDNDYELAALMNKFDNATDFDTAYACWEDLQKACSDSHLLVKYCDYYYCDMASNDVENFSAFMGIRLWGIQVSE